MKGIAPGTSDTQNLVNESTHVVRMIEAEPSFASLLQGAKGIFIVPKYREGARGSTGVLVIQHGTAWTDPAFLDVGAIKLRPNASGSGATVLLPMDQQAVNTFENPNTFSIEAWQPVGISKSVDVCQISKTLRRESCPGPAKFERYTGYGSSNIVVWTDISGYYPGGSVNVTGIRWDRPDNQAYYGRNVRLAPILGGATNNAGAKSLKHALPG
ncbi:MAG: YSC84-related protein [Methylovirgula sp.]